MQHNPLYGVQLANVNTAAIAPRDDIFDRSPTSYCA